MKSILHNPGRNIAVIVAHPDDETLWCGGLILMYPNHNWHIISLSRKSDPDRSPKFYKVLEKLNAKGAMGDLDDSPDQHPLREGLVKKIILPILPAKSYDLIITHDPEGEYTRHRRHEEIGSTVINLWNRNKVKTRELWTFAYEDGEKEYYPKAVEKASYVLPLPKKIWKKKFELITQTYGFSPEGFEAKTTPRTEAFWIFTNPRQAIDHLQAIQASGF
ncbi:PIG-L family deacetylase [Salegentibacter sp. F14]